MKRIRLASFIGLAIPLFLTACLGKRVKRENALTQRLADGLIAEGCYDCLLEAWAAYERLAASKYSNRDTITLRLFETSLLVLLRDKELGLDWNSSEGRARALAREAPKSVDADRLLMIARAVLPEGTGRPADWPADVRREWGHFVPRIPEEIAWLGATPLRRDVRDYLALALDCSYDARVLAPLPRLDGGKRRPPLAPGATPIISYRTGICMTAEPAMLAAVLARVPRFHEAAYFAGSFAVFGVEEDGGDKASVLLQKAYDRFPQSLGVSFVRGWLAQALGECGDAVRHFDAVIERDRAHEYAWLERTKCLSRLHNDSAAIASATALLDLRTASAQEALYWRAVSLLRLRELPRARADIDAAKALDRDGSTLTLAGMIENEQNDLAVAEGDLRAARAVLHGEQNCTATWTLALVLGKGARPAESAQMFEAAMGCYDSKVADLRYRIAKRREKSQPNPDFVAKRIAAMEADSADQRTRYYASALHAAGHSANAWQVPRALELLGIAARDPKLVSHVEVLRAAIAKRR